MHNCDLVNLEDMLQNGTVISGTLIEKPHSFTTACNIATQIMAQVASQQYGGQTISLAHLAPFVQSSREKIEKDILEENNLIGKEIDEKEFIELRELRVKREVARGVQIMQYQINTLLTTNGQAPFVSLNMYLNEAKSEEEKEDLALIIEEVLNQRIQGIKNTSGVWITPAFPKLLYVLENDNVYPGSKYYYLTELAARCTAKRMVPDYISEKIMLRDKIDKNGEGHCYPCMGAARGDETVSIKIKDQEYNNITIEDAFYLVKREIQHQDAISGFRCNGYVGQPAKDFQGVCGIYKLVHIPTGLYYIGSSKNISRRFIEHRSSFKHKGSLGDNYFIGDYDLNNLRLEILEECNIDDLFEKESKYVDFKNKDANCVNQKDPIKNGNFTLENRIGALEGQKYSAYKNKAYTWVKKVNTPDILIKSSNEYVPIRAIMKNTIDSPLEMYEITYVNNGEYRSINITEDHPLHTSRGRMRADNLEVGDELIDAITFETYPVVAIVKTGEKCETFDFETDNDKFDLSGIVSHNCRSFLTPYVDEQFVEDDFEII